MAKSSTERSQARRARLKTSADGDAVDMLGLDEPGGMLRAAVALLLRLDAADLRTAIALATAAQDSLHATACNDRCNGDATTDATTDATKHATVVQRSPVLAPARAVKTSDLSGISASQNSEKSSDQTRARDATKHATVGATDHATTDATVPAKSPDDDDEADAKRMLRQGYAKRFTTATGDAWMAWSANDRDITDIALWVTRLDGDAQANVDSILDAFFADPKVIEERWPWRWLAKNPGKYRSGKVKAPSKPRPANASRLVELDAAIVRATGAGDLDRADKLKAERDSIIATAQRRHAS